MAMARRVSLFEREVVVRLAPVAVELLHGAARVLSEGELDGDIYAGSTMLTVDLRAPPIASPIRRMHRRHRRSRCCMRVTKRREHARRIALAEAQDRR